VPVHRTVVDDPDVSVAGGGEQVAVPGPVEQVLSGEVERSAPAPAATLPNAGTGIGIGREVTLGCGPGAGRVCGVLFRGLGSRSAPAGQGEVTDR